MCRVEQHQWCHFDITHSIYLTHNIGDTTPVSFLTHLTHFAHLIHLTHCSLVFNVDFEQLFPCKKWNCFKDLYVIPRTCFKSDLFSKDPEFKATPHFQIECHWNCFCIIEFLSKLISSAWCTFYDWYTVCRKQTLWPHFIDRIHPPLSHSRVTTEDTGYFKPIGSQDFLVTVWSTWK